MLRAKGGRGGGRGERVRGDIPITSAAHTYLPSELVEAAVTAHQMLARRWLANFIQAIQMFLNQLVTKIKQHSNAVKLISP